MKASTVRVILVLSLLLNLGVLGAWGYRTIASSAGSGAGGSATGEPALVRHLQLSEEQQRAWHADEKAFLDRLTAGASEIRAGRTRLIDEIFADTPDPAAIEAARARIAALQDARQQLVITQLLRERDLLDPRQRALLAQVLRDQPMGPSRLEQLHRE